MRSPEKVAEQTYAPYGAVAQAADSITGDLVAYNERKNREQDAIDKSNFAIGTKNTTQALQRLDIEAKQKNYSREEYAAKADEILGAYETTTLPGVSDRNREDYQELHDASLANWRATSILAGDAIYAEQSSEQYIASLNDLEARRDWTGYEAMLEISNQDDTNTLLDTTQQADAERTLREWKEAEALYEKYPEARELGLESEYMSRVNPDDYDPGTMEKFNSLVKEYNGATMLFAEEKSREEGLAYTDFYQGITASTDPATIRQWAIDNKITANTGKVNALYNRLESLQRTKDTIMSISPDPTDAATRKEFGTLVTGNTPQEKFESALRVTLKHNVSPIQLDSYFNAGGYSLDPASFGAVAENYYTYEKETGSLYTNIHNEPQARLDQYVKLRNSFYDEGQATSAVLAYADQLDKERIQANEMAYTIDSAGIKSNETPQDTISDLSETMLEEAVKSNMSIMEGTFWDTAEVPDMPPQMLREGDRAAKTAWGLTENEEISAKMKVQSWFKSGWRATDINKGVKGVAKREYDTQFLKNPPNRGTTITREMLGQSLEGKLFLVHGESGWRTVSEDEVEFFQSVTNPQEGGRTEWILRVKGGLLMTADPDTRAPIKTTFWYPESAPDPRKEDELKLISSEVNAVIEQGEKQKDIHRDTFRKGMNNSLKGASTRASLGGSG